MDNSLISENQKEVLRLIVNTLNKNGISFMVSGGLAAIAYGGKRPLYDIDVDIHQKDVERVRELFRRYLVEDFHHLQTEKLDIWTMYFEIDGIPVDITQAEESYFINPDGSKLRLDADIEKATPMHIADIKLPVENKKDLVKYKKIAARDTDLEDVRAIEKILTS